MSGGRFPLELGSSLVAADNRNSELMSDPQISESWRDALGWLRGEYWQRFLFDAESELSVFA